MCNSELHNVYWAYFFLKQLYRWKPKMANNFETLQKLTLGTEYVGMQGGKRTSVQQNDVDINTGEFTEAQNEAMYHAIALSLSVDGETVNADMIKTLPTGLPGILFEQVITISKLTDDDLTLIKSFRKNE